MPTSQSEWRKTDAAMVSTQLLVHIQVLKYTEGSQLSPQNSIFLRIS